jgi:ABC-2 type transport system permease protein
LTFAYFAFWFGAAAFVVSFGRGSTFNALTLLGVWIFLVLLAPALLSSVVSTAFPVSESMETTVEQREGYHEKWDKPKSETMERFYQKYPEYLGFPVPEDRFSWGWYYAM